MKVAKKQYTSEVTKQYKEQTSDRKIRYTIEENLKDYPEINNDFKEWRSKQKVLKPQSSLIFKTVLSVELTGFSISCLILSIYYK